MPSPRHGGRGVCGVGTCGCIGNGPAAAARRGVVVVNKRQPGRACPNPQPALPFAGSYQLPGAGALCRGRTPFGRCDMIASAKTRIITLFFPVAATLHHPWTDFVVRRSRGCHCAGAYDCRFSRSRPWTRRRPAAVSAPPCSARRGWRCMRVHRVGASVAAGKATHINHPQCSAQDTPAHRAPVAAASRAACARRRALIVATRASCMRREMKRLLCSLAR